MHWSIFSNVKSCFILFRATDDDDNAKATASCTVAITDIQPAFTAHIVPYSFRLGKDVAVGMYFFVRF